MKSTGSRRGWLIFGAGLMVCLLLGGSVGVFMAVREGEDEDIERLAELALDMSRLNDDAMALSNSIEAAVREGRFEQDLDTLRAELANVELRSRRLRNELRTVANGQTVGEGTGLVREYVREIDVALDTFEGDVIGRLDPALGPGANPDEVSAAMADVRRSLDRQAQAMAELRGELADPVDEDAGQGASPVPDGESSDDGSEDSKEVIAGGSVEALGPTAGEDVAVEYEIVPGPSQVDESLLAGIEAEMDIEPLSGAEVDEALGEVELALYWPEEDLAADTIESLVRLDGDGDVARGDELCEYRLEGEDHCLLVRLASPEDSDDRSTSHRQATSMLSADEEELEHVAELLEESPPSLVEVIASGDEVLPACEPGSKPEMVTVGILDREGEAVHEAERSSASDADDDSVPSECFNAREDDGPDDANGYRSDTEVEDEQELEGGPLIYE